MDGRPLLQHSQPRTTPDHIVRGLRAVDPTADLYYLGWTKWVLVSVRANDEHRRAALRMILGSPATGTQPARPGLRRLLWLWETNPKYRANPGAFRQLLQKYELALLMAQGARPITMYQIQGEPTSAIVDDFRRMDWMYRTTTDAQLEQLLDAPQAEARVASRAELRDPARARAAHHYLTSINITPGISLTPKDRVRSGFSRVTPTPTLASS